MWNVFRQTLPDSPNLFYFCANWREATIAHFTKRRPYGVIFPPSPFLLCLPSLPSAELAANWWQSTRNNYVSLGGHWASLFRLVPLSLPLQSSSLIPSFPADLRLQAYRISKFKCPQGVCAIYVRPTNPARLEAIYSYCANEYVKILRHIARLLFLISTTRCKLRVKSQ